VPTPEARFCPSCGLSFDAPTTTHPMSAFQRQLAIVVIFIMVVAAVYQLIGR